MKHRLKKFQLSIFCSVIFLMIGSFLFFPEYHAMVKEYIDYKHAICITDENTYRQTHFKDNDTVLLYGEFRAVNTVTTDLLKNDYSKIFKHTDVYSKDNINLFHSFSDLSTFHSNDDSNWNYYQTECIEGEGYLLFDTLFSNEFISFTLYDDRLPLNDTTVNMEYRTSIYQDHLYDNINLLSLEGSKRYSYSVVPETFYGTLYVTVKGDYFSPDNAVFYYNLSVDEVLNKKVTSLQASVIIFWGLWFIAFILMNVMIFKREKKISHWK